MIAELRLFKYLTLNMLGFIEVFLESYSYF